MAGWSSVRCRTATRRLRVGTTCRCARDRAGSAARRGLEETACSHRLGRDRLHATLEPIDTAYASRHHPRRHCRLEYLRFARSCTPASQLRGAYLLSRLLRDMPAIPLYEGTRPY